VAATVTTTVVAVATCCGSVAAATLREGSLVAAAVLPVTLGALDERCLVGTDTSDLSTLAGARGDSRRHPVNAKNKKIKLLPLETGASGGVIAYLKVENPRFLLLEGSTGAVVSVGGVRRPFRRSPGSGHFRTRPRHLFLCHPRGSQ
jgi:hypothetical protein